MPLAVAPALGWCVTPWRMLGGSWHACICTTSGPRSRAVCAPGAASVGAHPARGDAVHEADGCAGAMRACRRMQAGHGLSASAAVCRPGQTPLGVPPTAMPCIQVRAAAARPAAKGRLHFLDFFDQLLTQEEPPKLRPELELDGTHMAPAYVEHLAAALASIP
eukprot:355305-Chlamydomonas_euryale.AAC.1